MNDSTVNKTIELYKNLGWKKLFAKVRFWDAPYLEVEKLVPKKGVIIDLGCGEGLFANFLALSSKQRKIYGVEIDKERVKQADRGLVNARFIHGDITKVDIPQADAILLFHVLHHLSSFNEQETLLGNCFQKLKKGGKLIIVEVQPEFNIVYLFAYLTDHFLVPWIFSGRFYDPIFFRKKAEWKKNLTDLGFSCQILDASSNKPFPHVIFVCKK